MKIFISIIKYTFFIIALLSCFHCGHLSGYLKGPECIKNNKKYGTITGVFRGKCWNYYERGLSYLEGECFDAAIDDFQKAIQCVRIDCKIDQYMAPTYGLHFAPYFPHRELGIVLYMKGDLENAKTKLETSLSYVDSERARFYLDLVRKKLIENEKIDSGPKISINSESAEIVSNSDSLVISGCVTDEFFISEVRLSGAVEKIIRYSWEGSEKKVYFNEELKLPQGHQKLIVKATNLAGMTAEKEQTIIVDSLGPTFLLNTTNFENSNLLIDTENQITICGLLYDDSRVQSLTINDQKIVIIPKKITKFCKQIKIGQINNDILFIAKDCLGNISSVSLDLKKNQSQNIKSNRHLLAWNCQFPPIIPPIPKKNAPTITIVEPKLLAEAYIEYEDFFLFKLKIVPNSGRIDSVKINGNEKQLKLLLNENIFADQGQKDNVLIFDDRISLESGKNTIDISVCNTYGHEISKTITVIKKKYPAFEPLKMHILNSKDWIIDSKGKITNDVLQLKLLKLSNSLVKNDRFEIIDIDSQAEYTLQGYIEEHHNPKIIESGCAKSLETGCLIKYKGQTLDPIIVFGCGYEPKNSLERCLYKLNIRIRRKFNRLQGEIKKVEGDQIYTNIQYEKLGFQKILTVFEKSNCNKFWYADIENNKSKNVQAKLQTINTNIRSGFQVYTK